MERGTTETREKEIVGKMERWVVSEIEVDILQQFLTHGRSGILYSK